VNKRSNAVVLLSFATILLIAPAALAAECSDKRVRRLADQGETIESIAEKCELDEEEVQEIIDSEPEPPIVNGGYGTLPSGTPVGQCACWGYVDPSHQQSQSMCRSGVAVPRACNIPCAAGGLAWQGVCK